MSVRLDGREVPSATRLTVAGDPVLVLSTTLPTVPLTLTSTYLGHEDVPTSILHLTVPAGRPAELEHRQLPRGELPVTHARGRCLFDHAAQLHTILAAHHSLVEVVAEEAAVALVEDAV